ncbi:MAG: hypothetical protein Q8L07_04140 [Sediminibacterium sp.]|nr:hypothetical protein [Sediminibacterium sp.]
MLYTLRKLIYQKYGEQKFALGCELVSRWVNFELRGISPKRVNRWTQQRVVDLCNAESGTNISFYYEEAEALRQLFGLQSINQLYN